MSVLRLVLLRFVLLGPFVLTCFELETPNFVLTLAYIYPLQAEVTTESEEENASDGDSDDAGSGSDLPEV